MADFQETSPQPAPKPKPTSVPSHAGQPAGEPGTQNVGEPKPQPTGESKTDQPQHNEALETEQPKGPTPEELANQMQHDKNEPSSQEKPNPTRATTEDLGSGEEAKKAAFDKLVDNLGTKYYEILEQSKLFDRADFKSIYEELKKGSDLDFTQPENEQMLKVQAAGRLFVQNPKFFQEHPELFPFQQQLMDQISNVDRDNLPKGVRTEIDELAKIIVNAGVDMEAEYLAKMLKPHYTTLESLGKARDDILKFARDHRKEIGWVLVVMVILQPYLPTIPTIIAPAILTGVPQGLMNKLLGKQEGAASPAASKPEPAKQKLEKETEKKKEPPVVPVVPPLGEGEEPPTPNPVPTVPPVGPTEGSSTTAVEEKTSSAEAKGSPEQEPANTISIAPIEEEVAQPVTNSAQIGPMGDSGGMQFVGSEDMQQNSATARDEEMRRASVKANKPWNTPIENPNYDPKTLMSGVEKQSTESNDNAGGTSTT